MPLTTQRKNNITRTLGLYFAEIGKVPTYYEYRSDGSRPKGMAPKFILSNFKSWNSFLTYMSKAEPELWALANNIKPEPKVAPKPKVEPKVAPKVEPKVAPKVTPKPKAKPAAKAASKKEK